MGNKKIDTLDLHGLRHVDARDIVNKYVDKRIADQIIKPVRIITGKSSAMKEIVIETCFEYKLKYTVEPHWSNTGYIDVSFI